METVKGTVYVKWIESKYMNGIDSRGNPVVLGRNLEREPLWSGLKPSDLLLLAAASCSTYDVLMILEKQREPVESVEVECIGEQEKDPPYKFVSIHLHYKIKGPLKSNKVERAIKLSEENYCSVTNTLKQAVSITSDFEVIS
jgi:putative redox protein